jgi:hypothetical protein
MVFEKLPRDTPLLAQPESVAYPGHGPILAGISFLDSKTPPSLCARSDNEHMPRLGRTCPHRRVVLRFSFADQPTSHTDAGASLDV